MGFLARLHKFFHGVDFNSEAFSELGDIVAEAGIVNAHRLVGTPGRADDDASGLFVDNGVVFEGVDRVVGGAHDFNVHRLEKGEGLEIVGCELGVDFIPDALGVFGAEHVGDAETSAEVEMNPFEYGVAGDFRHDAGELHPLFFRGGGAGDAVFVHAAFAHDFPDVVVGCREHLPGVGIVSVCGDFCNVGVVVRVNDRQIFHGGVDGDGGIAFQQVLVIEE